MRLEVRLEDETVWLNRQQLSVLFDRDIKTIGKHVNNALKEELAGISVVANFATTAADGKTYQVEYYNLDMILSIGYRVKSSRGVEFRRWANNVLKEYLLKGYSVNRRLTELEQRVSKTEEKIDFFVRTSLPPVEGVFYDGQIFDAYKFATDLIRSAKKSILIIDGAEVPRQEDVRVLETGHSGGGRYKLVVECCPPRRSRPAGSIGLRGGSYCRRASSLRRLGQGSRLQIWHGEVMAT